MKILVTKMPMYPDECPFYLPTGYCRITCQKCLHFSGVTLTPLAKQCQGLMTYNEYIVKGDDSDYDYDNEED